MAFVIGGVVKEKKEKHPQDETGNVKDYYSIDILCLGFMLNYQMEYNDWLEIKEGAIVKLRISPNNNSIKTEKSTYNYFEPLVTGIKEGKVNDLLLIPREEIGILDCAVIDLGLNEDGKSKGEYSKILMEGALLGEMTGGKDLAKDLKPLTKYSAIMSIGFKKNVLQIMPSGFKEVGVIKDDF